MKCVKEMGLFFASNLICSSSTNQFLYLCGGGWNTRELVKSLQERRTLLLKSFCVRIDMSFFLDRERTNNYRIVCEK